MPAYFPEGNTVKPSDDDARTLHKWAQILYDGGGPGDATPFPEGNEPKPGDDEQRLRMKINALGQGGGSGGSGGGSPPSSARAWSTLNLVVIGDSLFDRTTENNDASAVRKANVVNYLQWNRPMMAHDEAIGGIDTAAQVARLASNIYPLVVPGKYNVAYINLGTNDNNNSRPEADAFTDLVTIINGCLANGYEKVMVCTIAFANVTLGASWITDFNNDIRSLASSSVTVVDLAADSRFQDYTDTVYFAADQIHWQRTLIQAAAELGEAALIASLGFDSAEHTPDILWLRASDLAYADGVGVAAWVDAAQGLIASQATGANQPLMVNTGGIKAVRFSADNHHLVIPHTAALALSDTATFWVKVKFNTNTAAAWILDKTNVAVNDGYGLLMNHNGTGGQFFAYLNTTTGIVQIVGPATHTYGAAAEEFAAVFETQKLRSFINGVFSGVTNNDSGSLLTQGNTDDVYIGNQNGTVEGCRMDLHEIRIYSGAQFDSRIAALSA